FNKLAFAYCVAKLKLFASISATDAKPQNVSRNVFQKMKFLFKIFIFLIILSCQNPEIKKVNFDNFSIEVPYNWKKIKIKGIDSYVGGFVTQQNDSIIFDRGFYSNSLDTNQEIRDSVFFELIKNGTEYEHSLKILDSIMST